MLEMKKKKKKEKTIEKQRDEKNDELNKNTLGTPDKGEEIQEEEGIRWVVAEGQDPLSFTKLTLLCEGPKCNINSQLECGYPWGPVDAGYRPNYDNYNRNNALLYNPKEDQQEEQRYQDIYHNQDLYLLVANTGAMTALILN